MTNYKKGILELNDVDIFTPKDFLIGNLTKSVTEILIKHLNIPLNKFEPQILSSEFVEVVLYDYYGNSYSYDLKYLKNKDNFLRMQGVVGDTNNVYFTILDYKNKIGKRVIEDFNRGKFLQTEDRNFFKYGFFDRTTRSVTVISEQTASFLQANKNAIDSQIENFKENKRLMEQSNQLNKERTLLTNEQALANLDYQGNTNLANTLLSGANSLLAMPVNPVGSLMSLVGTGVNYGLSSQNLERLKNNQQELNNLNLEQVTLSALQSKTAFNQQVRAFNSKLKDLNNQPDSIANIGSDLSMQVGGMIDNIYIDIKIPNKNALKNAFDYFKMYGIIQNEFYEDISVILDNRADYNYIKMSSVYIKNNNINQNHLNMLCSTLLSGIRVWKYKEDMKFKDFSVDNLDKE